jgi:hypothetical protein
MNEQPLNPIQAIQMLLTPALGISAVGLLLLALNNRYSVIINRIRLLSEERRKYLRLLQKQDSLEYADNQRFMSITHQTVGLLNRSRLVRNAILSLQTGIGLFIISSVTICITLFTPNGWYTMIPFFVFVVGLMGVLVGILFAAAEVRQSFRIVLLDAKTDE